MRDARQTRPLYFLRRVGYARLAIARMLFIEMELQKRKLWTDESMAAAYQAVLDGKGLRETSRLYNVPVETLRRRVNGSVDLGCKPGPATILTAEQEDHLCE